MAANTRLTGYDEFVREVLTWSEAPWCVVERCRVYHVVYQHDAWCCTNYGAPASACNCNPIVSRDAQPKDW